jgi:hypothetical protein
MGCVWRWLVLLAGCGRIGFASVADADSADGSLLTYRSAVVADHPVAYWRLDDSGTTAGDVMGSFPGTYSGTCTHGVLGALAGDPDTATHFVGGGCTMAVNTAPSFAGTAPFTIELWYQPDLSPPDGYLVMKETRTSNGANPIDGYALVVNSGYGGAYVERVVGQNNNVGTAGVALPSQGFNHLVGTYDGAQLAFYLDGALAAMQPDSSALNATAAALDVGGFTPPPSGVVTGVLDEVAVYDYALAAARIALHYNLAINGPQL